MISRRNALLTTLFGAGTLGLRSLATGLPVSFLLNPRKAMASPTCASAAKAQYIIFNTSGAGDPIGANAPGTYGDSNIIHSTDPMMTPTTLTLGGKPFTAAAPWATLPQAVLDRTQFWHTMTNTPVHPKEPQVLELMGISPSNEMFPSLLAEATAPCLNTIQTQPIALGPVGLNYQGQTLPLIAPAALKDTLASPTGPLTQLQPLRDSTMNQIYAYYKNGATPTQQAYVDQMVISQEQLRSLNLSLLGTLASIKDNSAASQVLAAVTLIQMKVAPVIAIDIPFGGDNHSDPGLANETAQTVSGVATIVSLMAQLQSAGVQDQVTFMTLNVFGRTMAGSSSGQTGSAPGNGRGHNPNLQTSIVIGKPFTSGVIGAVAPVANDYGATAISSTTGAGSSSGDIQPVDTLGAYAQTMLTAVGGDPTLISATASSTYTGKVIAAALA
jgi:hypothetical protein